MSRPFRVSLACLALPITMAFAGCGDGLKTSTSTNPTGTPTPAPTPTPTATPVPATPTPTPAPTANPGAKCTLAPQNDCGFQGCCTEGGGNPYFSVIDDAQINLERTRPELFNSNGSLKVNEIEYTNILAEKITAMTGICTVGGGQGTRSKDEVGLKRDNNSSTNVDVIIGSSNTPYIGGVYNCRPAAF